MLITFCDAKLTCISLTSWSNSYADPSEHGEEAIKEVNADFSIPASFYRVDVRDQVAVEEAINGIVRDFGGLDVLLCSAGKRQRGTADRGYEFGRVI